MAAPLYGVRVIDLSTGVAGPYAAKLLADHGADVVKVEPVGGDPARAAGPFYGNKPHIEGSARFLFLNTNKRGIVLDLQDHADRAVVRSLIGASHAVIEDFEPGWLQALDLGYEVLDRLRPGIVLSSVTPWGQRGPYAGYRFSDIVAQGMGGPMLWTGSSQREPLRLGGGGALALYQAGAVTATATMMALFRQLLTGAGDHIDICIYETQAGSRDRAAPHLLNHIYNGMEPRRQQPGTALGVGMRPCLDGFVNINAAERRLPPFLRLIGRGDLAADPSVASRARQPEFVEEVEASYLGWLMQHTRDEAAALAQAVGILAAPVNTIGELLEDPHFRARGAWETVDHPHTGPIEYPGRPFILRDSPRPPARRAPLLDEHRDEVLRLATVQVRAAVAPVVPAMAGRLPLAGVRVADVTVVWAGPQVTQLLAEWGAEVIRVEPVTRIQPTTRYAERRRTCEMEMEIAGLGIATGGSYPDFEPGERRWDRNSSFNSHARNKLSMACDVMTAEGRAAFLELIATCDVFVENNLPATIEKAGITYEDLTAVRPDLVVLRMPGFGLSGPYRNYRAFGTHIESMVGHHWIRGYPDGSPDEGGDVYTADAIGGIQGALAVMFGLYHRSLTGRGQEIELAQAENFLPMLAELILDWTMNRNDPGPWGNRHRAHSPHGVYPCAGDDQWITIDVETDAEFAALSVALDDTALADDSRFATCERRLANRDELEALLGQSTSSHEKFALFHRLQRAGVTAGPLQTAAERLACPQLNFRGFFEYLENDVVGGHLYPGLTWRMERTPNRLRRAPVTLGQDNEYVYRELLGTRADNYQRLCDAGLVGTTYHLSGQS